MSTPTSAAPWTLANASGSVDITPSTAAKYALSVGEIATMYGDVASGVAVVYDAAPSTAVKYDFDFDFSVFEEEDGGDGDDFASLTDAALGVWE